MWEGSVQEDVVDQSKPKMTIFCVCEAYGKFCGENLWDLGLLENLIKYEIFGCFCEMFKGREGVGFLDGLMSLCVNDQRS